ncbi:MAG: type II toxin-antitoxin system HipA family toxin YjjJ [Pseudomonadota bacterium]
MLIAIYSIYMPRGPLIDLEKIILGLQELLAKGPLKASDAFSHLGISQSSFSKASARFPNDIVVIGHARKTTYALKRNIPDAGDNLTIYTIDESGKASQFGRLHAIYPKGFYFEPADTNGRSGRFFEDLPYFIDDLRPKGFLGRLIPRTHPELSLPNNIKDWSADDAIRYLTQYGCDLIGNLILGDTAFNLYLKQYIGERKYVRREEREIEYPKLAINILQFGDPGSSAGGEQPKFPAVVGPEMKPVLVKFSPKVESAVGQRRADLLICEHTGLKVLKRYGRSTTVSTIIHGDDQVFLETERFDRIGERGRKGLISLEALSAEYVGKTGNWTDISKELLVQKIISKEAYEAVRWHEMFGQLIANTDMHLANISFYFSAEKILGLAPAYDMLPMLYAPQNEQLTQQIFTSPMPKPSNFDIWNDVWMAGKDFWTEVSNNSTISDGFRKIAQANLEKVQALEGLQNLLP